MLLGSLAAGPRLVAGQAAEPAPPIVRVTGQEAANYSLLIDGAAYLALPVEDVQKLLKQVRTLEIELAAAQELIGQRDSLIAALERTNVAHAQHVTAQERLITQTRSLYEGYRDLYADLRTAGLYQEPLLRFSGGVGALRDDGDDLLPVLLLGASVRRISVWGFVNSAQSGFIFGLDVPLSFRLF